MCNVFLHEVCVTCMSFIFLVITPSQDGKSLSILLSKQNKKEWWASVIRGGPELDIKKVKRMPSKFCDLDMDAETRRALQKSVVSQWNV